MSNQRTNTKWAVALLALVAAMGMLAEGEAEDAERDVLVYCEGVAVFEAEKARGVPLENRTGHYDWDDSIDVAEQCPGMRPAAPAVKSREHIVYSYPNHAQPPVQIVQF
ncbi:hypothetical protein [Vreelandella venusta]|uniref:hypothetical protein n=1 Tax=Vreelandella venusta TaxID=44935 RepID=UPI0018DACE66|nr:hypothetical protein [Halomonas venusta]QPI65850.1 hypothetical protein IR195_09205 [Halomonas venusta]